MIPERIYVEGFLCYRDAQQVRFEGCSLWMLEGPNGSGKSALFDAVTFSLYGQHRAGRQNSRGLINRSSAGFVVEFDFRLENERYRARRTLTRDGLSTRQLYQWEIPTESSDLFGPCPEDSARISPCSADSGRWCEIPQTHSEQGFARWVHEHVALSYETFTASVLLLQGKAENLIESSPAQRHDLLAQIVGLDRFRELHMRALERVAKARSNASSVRNQIKELPRVHRQELQQLHVDVNSATRQHTLTIALIEELTNLAKQAETWTKLQREQSALLERDQELERITASRATIEAAHARWKFLSSHLEHLTQLETFENGLNECRAKIAAIEREQIRLRLERSRLERTAIDTTRSLDQLYRQLEDRKTTRERLTQDLTVLRFVLPSLERFQRARTELIQTDAHIRRHKQSFDEIQSTIEKFRRDAPNEAIMTRVRVELDQLAQGLLRSEATLNELEQQLERLSTVAGSAKCKYCQQPLPDSHITQERAHLESERAGARASFQELHQKHAAIRAEADSLMDRKARCEQHRAKLEWQASSEHAALESATRLNAEYQRFCCDAYEELPVHHQVCIAPVTPADWSDTTYPANEDMNSLRESVLRAQSESKELDQSIARFQQQIATCLSMQTREASDGKSLDEQLDKLAKELSKLTAQQAEYQGSHDALRSALASLPEGSSMGEPRCTEPEPSARDETGALSRQPGPEASSQRKRWDWMRLRNEWARLSKEGLTERLESLQRALTERQTVAIQLMATRQQLATLPPDATRSTAEVAAMLQDARLKRDATERGLREATSQVARLEDAANRRDALADQHRAAERHEYLWNRLSSLLGPDFLQQHLLRRAQRAIVDYANAILDRLAAGQLYLELRDENDARSRRAFDLLSCTATANGTAQDVAFLSGSQEFRVAVSLSLAIGQYAGATRRPVRAVIIDEGFGCLDAVNRQVMIQELQNLRNHLELILLVSHQEEFASAFRDGYRCELVGGASRLIPFHR